MTIEQSHAELLEVHVRVSEKKPNSALCGKEGVSTVSSAWGWWGPEGKGWEWMCKKCAKLEHK